MKPGRHLGVGGIHTQIRTSTILTQIKTANLSKIKRKNRDNPSDTYPTSLTCANVLAQICLCWDYFFKQRVFRCVTRTQTVQSQTKTTSRWRLIFRVL